MKQDLYTKAVLTVIAAALIVLSVEYAVVPRTVSAQAGPQQVVLVDSSGVPLKVVSGNLGTDLGVFIANLGGGLPIQGKFNNGRAEPAIPVYFAGPPR